MEPLGASWGLLEPLGAEIPRRHLDGLQDGLASLQDGLASLQDGLAGRQDGLADLQEGFAGLQDGFAGLQDGLASRHFSALGLSWGHLEAVWAILGPS